MLKILNKLLFHLKNILLPILLMLTIYIVMFMFQRLEKNPFNGDFMEFIKIVFPFVLLIILNIINLVFNQNTIENNTYYNITSILVMITIGIFCYRAIFDSNMIFWHKYGYKLNFNYFSDQISSIKVMLYGLSLANIILMISNSLKIEENTKVNKNKNIKHNYHR